MACCPYEGASLFVVFDVPPIIGEKIFIFS